MASPSSMFAPSPQLAPTGAPPQPAVPAAQPTFTPSSTPATKPHTITPKAAPKAAAPATHVKIANQPTLPYAAAPYNVDTLTKMGAVKPDPEVSNVQQQLVNHGYKIQVDGVVGPETKAALSQYLARGGTLQAAPRIPTLEQGHAPATTPAQDEKAIEQAIANNAMGQIQPLAELSAAAAPSADAFAHKLLQQGAQIAPGLAQTIEGHPGTPFNQAQAQDYYAQTGKTPPGYVVNGSQGANGLIIHDPSHPVGALIRGGGKNIGVVEPMVSPVAGFAGSVAAGAIGAPGGGIRAIEHPEAFASQLVSTFAKGLTDYHDPAMAAINWSAIIAGTYGATARISAAAEALPSISDALTRSTLEGGSLLHSPPVQQRFFTLPNGETSRLLESGNHAFNAVQQLHDKVMQWQLNVNPDGPIAAYAKKRIAGYATSARRVEEPLGMVTPNRLRSLVNRTMNGFEPWEQRVFNLTSENRSVQDAINHVRWQFTHATDATERLQHEHELKLLQQIKDAGVTREVTLPGGERQVIVDPTVAPKLAYADGVLAAAGDLQDKINVATGQMTPEGAQVRINGPGQIMRGGQFRDHADVAQENLDNSEQRQMLLRALTHDLGPQGADSLISALDSQAHRAAQEHGDPLHPEHFYEHLASLRGALNGQELRDALLQGGKLDPQAARIRASMDAPTQWGGQEANVAPDLMGHPDQGLSAKDRALVDDLRNAHPNDFLFQHAHAHEPGVVWHESAPSRLAGIFKQRVPWIYDNVHDLLHVGNPGSEHWDLMQAMNHAGAEHPDEGWDGVWMMDTGKVHAHSNLGAPDHGNPLDEHSLENAPTALKAKLRSAFGSREMYLQRGGPLNPQSAIKDQSHLDEPGAYGVKGAIRFDPHGAHLYSTHASDFSTWAHELLGHYNLEKGQLDKNALRSIIRAAGVQPDRGAVFDAAGNRLRAGKNVINPKLTLRHLTPDEYRHVQEYFATQLEAWLKQGRTSNPSLTKAMRRSAKLMGDIYGAGELPELDPKVSRLFDRLFNYGKPKGAGIHGGEDPLQTGRTYLPAYTTEKTGNAAAARRFAGSIVGKARPPLSKEAYRGEGLNKSAVPERPAVLLAKALQRNIKFLQTLRARREVGRLGTKELPATADANHYVLVNTQEINDATTPEWAKVLIGQKSSTIHDATEADTQEAISRYQQFHDQLFVTKENVQKVFAADPAKLKAFQDGTAIDGYKWVDRRLIGRDLREVAQPYKGWGWAVNDAILNAEKNAIVYLKPGHFATRLLANAGFNLVHGSLNPRNMTIASRWWNELSQESQGGNILSRWLDQNTESKAQAMAISGQGYAQSLEGEDTGLGHSFVHAGAHAYGKFVDAPFRFNALVLEARKIGIKSAQELADWLSSNDPRVVAERNHVGIKVNREAGDYARMGPVEQRVVRRLIFFYPWLKTSVFFAGRSLLEHPVKSALILNTGLVGKQQQDKRLGQLAERDQGLIPFGSGKNLKTSQPGGINPIATPAEAVNTVEGLLGASHGGIPSDSANQISSWLGPVPKLLGDMAFHLTPFGDAAPPKQSAADIAYNDLLSGTPEVQLWDAFHKGAPVSDVNTHEFPSSPATQATRFGAGSWFPRPTNKDTANYEGYKAEATATGNNFSLDEYNLHHNAQQVGMQIPQDVLDQLRLRDQMIQSIPKGSDAGHKAVIAGRIYAQATGDHSLLDRAVYYQHDPARAAYVYELIRERLYGRYTDFNSEVKALLLRKQELAALKQQGAQG